MMSAENQASFSPCPPGTHARCAAASLSPASSLRCCPSGWLRSVSTRSCLVTRSALGLSAFNGVLALAAADVTLHRDVAVDLAPPFLGAALLGFRDFAMERDDMGLRSVG